MRQVRLSIESLEERSVPSSDGYVRGLYTQLLHRDADGTGVANWVGALTAGASPRLVTLGIVASLEYRTNLVTTSYQNLLHRDPDAPALPLRLASLRAGVSPELLTADLVASAEYFALHGGTNASWLDAVYSDVLGRPVDGGGAESWGHVLQDGASRLAVALAIVQSPEALTRTVTAAYHDILGREPDARGLASWVSQLQVGLSATELAVNLAASNEAIASAGGMDPVTRSPLDSQATVPESVLNLNDPIVTGRQLQNEARAARGYARILFLGDSITDLWANGAGQPVWQSLLAPLGAEDFAIRSLRTSNVLWQVRSGQLAAVSPDLVVLMVGVNNLFRGQNPWAVAEGISAVVGAIRAASPRSRILLLGILPTSAGPAPFRAAIAQVNAAISWLADGRQVRFLDLGKQLPQQNGGLAPGLLSDGVHPTAVGYQYMTALIWQPLHEMAMIP